MFFFRYSLLTAGALGALFAAPAAWAGGPNIAVCWTLSNQFNKCVRDYQYPRRGGGDDIDAGGWSRRGGYRGGDGRYGAGWDAGNWRGGRRPRGGDAAAACQGWLIQMKAAGCF